MLRQDDQVSEDLGQFPIALLAEMELDLAVRDCDRLGHVLEIAAVHRTVGFEHLERPDHVVDGDRLAVMPFGARVEPIGRG